VNSGSVEGLRALLAARTRRVVAAAATGGPVFGGQKQPARPAAVLVPIVGRAERLQIVLFERTHAVADHKGEICFPGGSIEPQDRDPIHAALRETREELGIPSASIRVLGCLDDVRTVGSNYVITPVVGHIDELPVLTPDPLEVAKPLIIQLNDVVRRGAWVTECIDVRGRPREVLSFRVGDGRIWGATARILRALLDVWQLSE
jgi:8-oxo-dGTP pyrophosphatase MutT (NUDIX family)